MLGLGGEVADDPPVHRAAGVAPLPVDDRHRIGGADHHAVVVEVEADHRGAQIVIEAGAGGAAVAGDHQGLGGDVHARHRRVTPDRLRPRRGAGCPWTGRRRHEDHHYQPGITQQDLGESGETDQMDSWRSDSLGLGLLPLLLGAASGCAAPDPDTGELTEAATVESLVATGCSTAVVLGLSWQIAEEVDCLMPGQADSA